MLNRLVISTFLVCFGYSVGFCQTNNALSLSQAVALALANNFDIKIERLQQQTAQNNNTWGQAGALPNINFSLGQGNTFNNVQNPAAFLQGTTLGNGITPAVTLDLTLFDGFAVQISKQRLENLQRQADGSWQIALENTVQNIMRAYYAAVLAQERIVVLKKVLQISQERYDYVRFRQQIGSAAATDVLLEKTNLLSDSMSLVSQEIMFRDAMRNLNVILAETDHQKSYQLTDKLQLQETNYTWADLETKLLENNANLKNLQVAQNVLNNDLALRKADLMPRIALGINSSYNLNRQDLNRAIFPTVNPDRALVNLARTANLVIGLNLSVPIFNGGQVRRSIKNAALQVEIGQLRQQSLMVSLKRDLAAAFDLYTTRKTLANIATANKETAYSNLQLAEEKFKTGRISSFEYRILQENFLNAANSELQAVFNLIDSNVTLLRLTGSIVREN